MSATAHVYEADQKIACVDTYNTTADGAAVQNSVTRMQVPSPRVAQSFTASHNKQLGNSGSAGASSTSCHASLALPQPDVYVADVHPQAPPVQEGAQMPSHLSPERWAEACLRSSPEPDMVRTKSHDALCDVVQARK